MEHENKYKGHWEWVLGLCAGGGNGLVEHRGPLETVGGGVTRKRFICSGEGNPFPLSWLDLGPNACVKEGHRVPLQLGVERTEL